MSCSAPCTMTCGLTRNTRTNSTPNTLRRYGLSDLAGNLVNVFESQEVTIVLDSDDEAPQKTKQAQKVLSDDEGAWKAFGTCPTGLCLALENSPKVSTSRSVACFQFILSDLSN